LRSNNFGSTAGFPLVDCPAKCLAHNLREDLFTS
jgi:hypothetical protein